MTEDEVDVLREYGGRRVCAVRYRDDVPALGFLNSLPRKSRNKFKATFDVLLMEGNLLTRERFRKIQDGGEPSVWEMKVHDSPGWRLYCIPHGQDWYATHGSPKRKDRELPIEAERARRMYESRGR